MRLNSSLCVDVQSVELVEGNDLRHRGSSSCREVKMGSRIGS